MKWDKVVEKAQEEMNDVTRQERIDYYVTLIRENIEKFPKGSEIGLPQYIKQDVEDFCDSVGIPITNVGDTCYSIAKTYLDLYLMEERR